MKKWRYELSSDYIAGGSFSGTVLDTLNNPSIYNHPALTGDVVITSTQLFTGATALAGGTLPADVLGSGFAASAYTWAPFDPAAVSIESGSYYTFSTTARQVVLTLAGRMAAAPALFHTGPGVYTRYLRNGVIATVSVDGVQQALIDTYNALPQLTLYLDGGRHTIRIQHTGGYNAAIVPIGAVVATVGASLGPANVSVTPIYHSTIENASYRLLATAAGTYSVYRTPQGGAETLLTSGLTTGTTYSATIPGVTLRVNGTLVFNDAARFTTDAVQLGIASVQLGFSSGGPGAAVSYTSPVMDSGSDLTQWFLARWTQNSPIAAFIFSTGRSPVDDGTWNSTTLTATSATLPDSGEQRGLVGLAALPRGRYARFTVNLQPIATAAQWVRDLALYSWIPEQDTAIVAKLPLGYKAAPEGDLTALLGAMAVLWTDTRGRTLDYVDGFAVNTARDDILLAHGQDLDLPPYTGEQPETYQKRLLAALQSKPYGGSAYFIQAQLAALTGFDASLITVATISGSYQYQVTIPAPVAGPNGAQYPNMVGLSISTAQTIIADYVKNVLNPITSVITPNNVTSNIVFV